MFKPTQNTSSFMDIKQGEYITLIERIEKEIPVLLKQDDWNTLYIDYELPIVERAWRQHGEHRIFLHRIHPCEREQSLWHPHPWPSAVKVISGEYEMGVGYGEKSPPVAALMIAKAPF